MVLLKHVHVALSAAAAALGSALFIAFNSFYQRRVWAPQRDYCTISEEEEETVRRQVLVLGLDGAGKSSVLQGLSRSGPDTEPRTEQRSQPTRPTRGFNFISLRVPRCQIDFLEIGGGEDLRGYWSDYLRRTHILVFIVDSSDWSRLSVAKSELHRLLGAEPQLPVVVLANKQDKAGAASISELREALSLQSVSEERKLFLLAAQLDPDAIPKNSTTGLQSFQDLLQQLV
uniref:ADP ribosylation factor like GTPase 10 n=1 Tax=Neogobius melanostomus TaxID=47308 RepID=A0A8C6T981_9GOBI